MSHKVFAPNASLTAPTKLTVVQLPVANEQTRLRITGGLAIFGTIPHPQAWSILRRPRP